jgi:hypothetical protein
MPTMKAFCLRLGLYNWIRAQMVANNWTAAVALAGAAAAGVPVAVHLPAGLWIVLPVIVATAPGAYAAWWSWMYDRVRSPSAQQQREQLAAQYKEEDPPEPKDYPGGLGAERAADTQLLAEYLTSDSDTRQRLLIEKLKPLMLRDAVAADWKEAGLKELVERWLEDRAMVEHFVKLRLAISESLMAEWLTYQIRHGEVVAALMMRAFQEHVRRQGGHVDHAPLHLPPRVVCAPVVTHPPLCTQGEPWLAVAAAAGAGAGAPYGAYQLYMAMLRCGPSLCLDSDEGAVAKWMVWVSDLANHCMLRPRLSE